MAVQTDFIAAVNQIAAERNIDIDEVVTAIADAIKTGFRQNFPEESNVNLEVRILAGQGQISVLQIKKIVEKVTDKEGEINLKDAQKLSSNSKLGDELEIDITPEGDFGRVAAQSAKQVILQKIREAERETQLREYNDRIGEVEFAVVQRMDGDSVIWEVGRAIALMPAEDRIPSEFYRSGSRHKVLLKEIKVLPKGKTLLVSRSDPGFLKALFFLEVPELASESVEIKAIAREAGSRTKVAVVSNVDGIDPIGSCVGQRGIRINAIMNELRIGEREEKIDIIAWDDDLRRFIANALSPAEVLEVRLTNEEYKEAVLVVEDEQLSLAIGKDGQNVRLAAKLTGWKLDIVGKSEAADMDKRAKPAKPAKIAKAKKAKAEDPEAVVEVAVEEVAKSKKKTVTKAATKTPAKIKEVAVKAEKKPAKAEVAKEKKVVEKATKEKKVVEKAKKAKTE